MSKHYFLLVFLLLLGLNTSLKAQFDPRIEAKIDSILPLLSLEEKVAMCHAQSKFSSPGVPRLGIPELWMSDGPHGVRGEINWDNWGYANWTNDSITAFPALTALASTFNPDLSYQYGVALGEEARYRKKDVLLGPGVNIYRTPMNGRNFEYMGEDPHLASIMAVLYIHGVQQNGVATSIKHYVLNNQELWRGHINVEVSDRALYEIYLPAFKASVLEGGSWSLMGAYNQFRGQHCCHNEVLLNNILKEDWGFDGVVITDWGGAHNTIEAARFGLDLEMGTGTDGLSVNKANSYDYYYLAKPFLQLLNQGELEEDLVNDKVRRILRLMYRTSMNPNRGMGKMNNDEHLAVARKVGQEAIVLLKNEESFFPINPNTEQTIAIIGENATRMMTLGGGSSELKAKDEISPLRGIKSQFSKAKILHTMGYASGPPAYARVVPSPYDADSLKAKAIEYAQQADIVLFIGGLNKNYLQDSEGGDRVSYNLPFGQDALLNEILSVNENVGVLLISGNAVAMPWVDQVKGIMQGWYLGSQAGHALADVISGAVNASGKLPFSFPKALKDNSAHHYGEISYPGDSINQIYKDDILVGYRWHDTKKITPQFAFGHGLSYTSFGISNIQTDQMEYRASDLMTLTAVVTNTGKSDGAEVLQVYVGKPNSEVERALKELKGFKKVFLKPGESKEVKINIQIKDLSYYNERISDWTLEKGEYVISIGTASDRIEKQLTVKVK